MAKKLTGRKASPSTVTSLRLPLKVHRLVERAAKRSGETFNAFLVTAAAERALRVMGEPARDERPAPAEAA